MANTNLQYLKQFKNFLIAELKHYCVLFKQFIDKFAQAMAKFFTVLLHYGLYTGAMLILVGLFLVLTLLSFYSLGFVVWIAAAVLLYFIIDKVNDIYTYNVSGLIAVILLIIYFLASICVGLLALGTGAYLIGSIELLLTVVLLIVSWQVRKKHFSQPPSPPNLPPGYPPPGNPPPGRP